MQSSEPQGTTVVEPKIIVEHIGAAGVVTLNRRSALNAFDDEMRQPLSKAYMKWTRDPQNYAMVIRNNGAKVFCAGGDIKAIVEIARQDIEAARAILAEEYRLNWIHECYPKPTVSLIDGPVMGSGVGLTAHGTHRVAGERYRWSMPETAIGFFPDVGSAWLFAQMPWPVGLYLGLTGRAIGAADALALGLLTHVISDKHFADIAANIIEANPVDPLLDGLHQDPGKGELDAERYLIERYFGAPSITAIMEALRSAPKQDAEWASAHLAQLTRRSPLALAVTDRHIREARAFDVRGVLQRDYRLARHFLESHDFHEGVRAYMIDKDQKPNWQAQRVEDISKATVDAFFAWRGIDELALPIRDKMLQVRV